MEKIILLSIGVLLSSLLLISCGEDNPAANNGGPNGGDTTFSSFVILTPASGPADTLYFTDRNLCRGSYSSSANNTYCLLNDTTTSQSISATFDGNTTGNPTFTFGFLSYAGGSYSGSGVTGAVTLYEAVGGKIKGTYNGTFSNVSVAYQVSAVFTVTRTQ